MNMIDAENDKIEDNQIMKLKRRSEVEFDQIYLESNIIDFDHNNISNSKSTLESKSKNIDEIK